MRSPAEPTDGNIRGCARVDLKRLGKYEIGEGVGRAANHVNIVTVYDFGEEQGPEAARRVCF